MDDRVLGSRAHRRGERAQPLLQPITGTRDPVVPCGRLGEAAQARSRGRPPSHDVRPRRAAAVDQGHLAVRGCAVAPHHCQRLGEARHRRLRGPRVAGEQVHQVPAGKVLDDGEVGRVVGAVTVDQVDRGDPEAEGVQPRVRGLEQVEPDAGRERVGEVAVAAGGRPVVLGVLPQVGDRRRRVVHRQAVDALRGAAREPLDPLQPSPAAQRGPRRPRQLIPRHCSSVPRQHSSGPCGGTPASRHAPIGIRSRRRRTLPDRVCGGQ